MQICLLELAVLRALLRGLVSLGEAGSAATVRVVTLGILLP